MHIIASGELGRVKASLGPRVGLFQFCGGRNLLLLQKDLIELFRRDIKDWYYITACHLLIIKIYSWGDWHGVG